MTPARAGLAALLTLIATALFALAPWPAGSYRHTDFFQFWAAPAALLEGASPYDHAWIVAFAARVGSRALDYWPAGWVSPYPVWTDVLTLPLAIAPYRIAAAAWLVLQLAAMSAAFIAVGRSIFRVARRDALVFGAIVLGFEPLWALIGGGNMTGFLTAAVAGAFAASLGGHAFVAGVLVGLLAAKPHLAIVVATLVVALAPSSQRRAMLAGAVSIGVALFTASIALRPGWPLEWLDVSLVSRMSAEANASAWTLDRVLAPAVVIPLAGAAVALFAVWLWRDRPAYSTAVGAGIALALFVAPHERHYDQLLLLVSAALVVARIADLGARDRVLATVACMAVFVFVPWWLYGIAVARGIPRAVPDLHEEWSAFVPLLVLLLVIVVDHIALRSRRAAVSRRPLHPAPLQVAR